MINSRNKGKVGERECAAVWTDLGWPSRRGQQFSGEEGRDIVGPPLHVEVKRFKKQMRFFDWHEQAERDAADGDMPVVCFRRAHGLWFIAFHLCRVNEFCEKLKG